MSNENAQTAGSSKLTWIVSPSWDLAYLIATPLAIVPVVVWLAQRWFSPEEISLVVIAFASAGHHLPGFIRAYGDADLFRRFRLRFTIMPVLLLAMALLFSPPELIARSFHLPWKHLHGLELLLLLWGTWHGLMQTYGFMRIYDAQQSKQLSSTTDHAAQNRQTVWLDFMLCLCIFIIGVVFSEARVYGIAGVMWECGFPLFGHEAITWLRWGVGIVSLGVILWYTVHLIQQSRIGRPVNWNKLLLALSTGALYWYSGWVSTNLLIGLALFEIYHAVQYDAVVWIYNRRLMGRAREKFGPLGFMFRDRWAMLSIYLAAIAAFGMVRFFAADGQSVYQGATTDARQWLMAFFVTSTFLHFYFDGFIWKVREQKTRQTLTGDNSVATQHATGVRPTVHFARCLLLFIMIGGLLWLESRGAQTPNPQQRLQQEERVADAQAALTPNLPESQLWKSRRELSRGNLKEARQLAEQALTLRPRSHAAQANLGMVLLEQQKWNAAAKAFRRAIDLSPNFSGHHTNLALALLQSGNAADALVEYKKAKSLGNTGVANRAGVISSLAMLGKTQQAIREAGDWTIAEPNEPQGWLSLGTTLIQAGHGNQAIEFLHQHLKLRPTSYDGQLALATALVQENLGAEAIGLLQPLIQQRPNDYRPLFQFANALATLGKYQQAAAAYQQCAKLAPNVPAIQKNLAAVQAALE